MTTVDGLQPATARVLAAINEFTAQHGHAPDNKEIGSVFGWHVSNHLAILEARGYIRRAGGSGRPIELTGKTWAGSTHATDGRVITCADALCGEHIGRDVEVRASHRSELPLAGVLSKVEHEDGVTVLRVQTDSGFEDIAVVEASRPVAILPRPSRAHVRGLAYDLQPAGGAR